MEKQLMPQLVMERKNLNDLPELVIPEGFVLRNFEQGDEAAWNRLANIICEAEFETLIRSHRYYRPERVKLICDGDIPVATATAWCDEDNEAVGCVHMVATDPAYRGKGLGRQITNAVLHHIKQEGKETVVLKTDDFRLPAIKAYIRLGFEPKIVHENQVERWEAVYKELEQGKR